MTSIKKTQKKPVWLKYTEQEVREIILKLKEREPALTAEKIGLILRDNYGIPTTRLYGLKLGTILKEAKKYEDPELKSLTSKLEKNKEHLKKNKQDMVAGRSEIITKAKLRKVQDYLSK